MGCAEHLGLQKAALGLMPSAPALLSQLGPARPLEVCKHALKALAEMMSLLVHFPWGSSSSKKGGPKSLHPALTGAAPHNPRSQGVWGVGVPPGCVLAVPTVCYTRQGYLGFISLPILKSRS